MNKLRRSTLEPHRYNYLDEKDSRLYDRARAGTIPAAEAQVIIEKLLERLAAASQHAHCNSR